MNKKLKPAALLLTALILVSWSLLALGSCSNGTGTETGTVPAATSASAEVTADEGSEETELKDDLPDVKLTDQEFRIASTSDLFHYIINEEDSGSVCDSAVYKANRIIEERFDIKFTQVVLSSYDTSPDEIGPMVKSGDDLFDIGMLHDTSSGAWTLRGYFRDLNTLPYIDTSKPWYPEFTVKSLSFAGKMYLISNFMTYFSMDGTRVMWMNMDIAGDYNLPDPFEMVENRTWTLDKMMEISSAVYEDTNSDNLVNEGDTFGFTHIGNTYCWVEAFGIEMLVKNEAEKTLTFNGDDSRIYDLVEKMQAFAGGANKSVFFKVSGASSNVQTLFAEGKTLLTYMHFKSMMPKLNDSTVNYAILPMPLLNEDQDRYYGACTDVPISVPVSAEDTEKIGLMIEAMSAEGYRTIKPACYDLVLKFRYANDYQSSKMLDTIFSNRVLSFTYIYREYGGSTQMKLISDNVSAPGLIASYLKKNGDAANIYAKSILKFYYEGTPIKSN